jgi:DNA-directed RNA polymerase subunit N
VVIVIFPIRCFSCGNVISEVYEEYRTRLKDGENPEEILNDLEIKKYCCRRMFASHRLDNDRELFDDIVEYK